MATVAPAANDTTPVDKTTAAPTGVGVSQHQHCPHGGDKGYDGKEPLTTAPKNNNVSVEKTAAPVMPSGYINNLNQAAILKSIDEMFLCQSRGKDVPVEVKAVWKQGIVSMPGSSYVCYPPTEIALDQDLCRGKPTPLSYCPLAASPCFAFAYMIEAAKEGLQFDSCQMVTSATCDMSGFYHHYKDPSQYTPWTDLNVTMNIKGPVCADEMRYLGVVAHDNCPAAEILEDRFPFELSLSGSFVNRVKDHNIYYDMEAYKKLSNNHARSKMTVNQECKTVYHCHNESQNHSNAIMEILATEKMDNNNGCTNNNTSSIPVGVPQPIGADCYPSSLSLYMFGSLSFVLHTLAVRVAMRNYHINYLEGTIQTTVNNRKVLGVDPAHVRVFNKNHTKVCIQMESDCPNDILRDLQQEVLDMCPSIYAWSKPVKFNFAIKKVVSS